MPKADEDGFTIITSPFVEVRPLGNPEKVNEDFELIPAWTDETEESSGTKFTSCHAALDIKKCLSRKRSHGQAKVVSADDENVENLYSLLKTDEKGGHSCGVRVRRLFDANRERLSGSSLTSVEFNKQFRIIMTASLDTTLAFFNCNGAETSLMHDIVFEKFPLSCAKFTMSGEQVILTGKKHFFKVYNLATGQETRPASFIGVKNNEQLRSSAISPKDSLAAFPCLNSGRVYLVDLRSFEKVGVAHCSGSVESFCFSQNGELLNTFSNDGTVLVFDLRNQPRPVHRWQDYGCSGASSIAVSDDSAFIACGSHSGYVNLYTRESVMNGSRNPRPLKSIGNLTTGVDQLLFHPDCKMLFMSSSLQDGSARLFDVDSLRVYSNFPVCMGKMNKPTSVGFSPNGGYLSVGQESGQAALFRFETNPAY